MRVHPLEVRERVLAGVREGLSHREVARREGVAETTIDDWLRLWRTTGSIAPRPHGGGARKLLNTADLAMLKQLRKEDPEASAELLAARLAEHRGVRATSITVQRALRAMGVTYHRRAHKPLAARSGATTAKPYAPEPDRLPPSLPDRRAYPTDLTDAEWELLEPLIPRCKPGGRPETYPRRELVNAMLYILRNGNTWRALPHDLPPWKTVYYYFRQWRMSGLWMAINDQLHGLARRRAGRGLAPTGSIIDSQSAHTTEKGGPTAGMATSA